MAVAAHSQSEKDLESQELADLCLDGAQVWEVKIYTKTGDAGETGLVGGVRIRKTDIRIHAIGDVDELNAWIGLLRVAAAGEFDSQFQSIQNALFELGAELASPGESRFETLDDQHIKELEKSMDTMSSKLPELRNFVLPGGSEPAARAHVARAMCRRAERSVLALHESAHIRSEARIYLNRLADWLFVAARTLNQSLNVPDVNWKRGN